MHDLMATTWAWRHLRLSIAYTSRLEGSIQGLILPVTWLCVASDDEPASIHRNVVDPKQPPFRTTRSPLANLALWQFWKDAGWNLKKHLSQLLYPETQDSSEAHMVEWRM